MAKKSLDLRGLKCLKIIWKLSNELGSMRRGEIVEVIADCPSFTKDVKRWCQKHRKVLIFIREERDGLKRCQVQT